MLCTWEDADRFGHLAYLGRLQLDEIRIGRGVPSGRFKITIRANHNLNHNLANQIRPFRPYQVQKAYSVF